VLKCVAAGIAVALDLAYVALAAIRYRKAMPALAAMEDIDEISADEASAV